MKKLLLLISLVGLFIASGFQTYAACDSVTSSTAGKTYQDGCYVDGEGKTYSLVSGGGGGSSAGSASSAGQPGDETMDTGDESTIFGNKISDEKLRKGDVTLNDIPKAIVGVIQFLLGVAGAISVLALIYHAVKMQLASGITGDSSGVDKAKAGMKGAIIGFVVSILAWFLVTRFVEILSSIS